MTGLILATLLGLCLGAFTGAGVVHLRQKSRQRLDDAVVQQAEQQHQDSRKTLQMITDSAFEGVYWVDPERLCYLGANPVGLKALQVTLEELLALPLSSVHPEHMDELKAQFDTVLHTGKAVRFSIPATRRDGRTIPVELCCAPVLREGRTVILAMGRDLSRWERSSRQIRRINQLYAVLSQSNRAIGQCLSPEELLAEICRIAVAAGGFQVAWAATVHDAQLQPVFRTGHSEAWPEDLGLDLQQLEAENSPLGQCALRNTVAHANDLQGVAWPTAWRQVIQSEQLQSMAALPVYSRGSLHFVLAFFSNAQNYIDPEMASLLADLAGDLQRGLQRLETEQERLRAVHQVNQLSKAVEQSADAIMIVNMEGRIDYINPRFTEITGYPGEEVLGQRPGFLCTSQEEAARYDTIFEDLKQGRSWRGDFRNRRKNGDLYWSHETISPIRDEQGVITHFISTAEDCTELRKAQDMIQQLAFFDPLTGLPNRRLLQDRMRQALESARRHRTQVAILFLDLDKFKHINDSLGHPAGDQLLREISRRLTDTVRATDTVARLGGDEFTVVLTGVRQIADVTTVAEKILKQIRLPVELEGFSMQISTSIGITLFPDDGADINDLLRNADLAMYHSKSLGRNNYQFYTEEINQKALGHVELESRLRKAIDSESFLLHYQPQICARSGHLIGIEALVRWSTHDRGLIPPSEFIPLAEETGLIEPIGEWVLQRALQETGRLHALFQHPIKVAINLSAYQFRRSSRLRQQVQDLLGQTSVDPGCIELELTESMLVDNVDETIVTLNALRELGIKLAIDDFGTGYSSLNYLKRFPIDVLKIDRSFVRELESNPNDAAITAAIIAMGHQLGLKVVAEGVENNAQLKFLRQSQCDFYQGYLCSPPVPLDGLIQLVREGRLKIGPGEAASRVG